MAAPVAARSLQGAHASVVAHVGAGQCLPAPAVTATGLAAPRRAVPGSRVEPVSPALAGGFFTTEQPGQPWSCFSRTHPDSGHTRRVLMAA